MAKSCCITYLSVFIITYLCIFCIYQSWQIISILISIGPGYLLCTSKFNYSVSSKLLDCSMYIYNGCSCLNLLDRACSNVASQHFDCCMHYHTSRIYQILLFSTLHFQMNPQSTWIRRYKCTLVALFLLFCTVRF